MRKALFAKCFSYVCKEMHFESTGCERGSYATVGILYVEELALDCSSRSLLWSPAASRSHACIFHELLPVWSGAAQATGVESHAL